MLLSQIISRRVISLYFSSNYLQFLCRRCVVVRVMEEALLSICFSYDVSELTMNGSQNIK